ncbi:hypothetical protein KNR01_19150, partial [Acinetobacter baumannii]|nr:hypothetical protein [Acinetobacter baumannii]MCO9059017.1 hypothetical protein [Acinetobacter baumannii]MCO9062705.1 hypothetical protein [Acinetobacter baumannii]MCO9066357.1 hypothetical protein [Acinetobacter baumannii]MCO9070012.1 hypothetical protein [Acinetobacter baumannii]
KNDFTLKVPTMEGIHLLYLEINKIFSLSCQPICNSAQKIPPIEIYFFIKQTFLITTIKSYTSHQASESIITALSHNKDSEISDFIYIYKFYRTKHSENKVTFGSGNLRLINQGQTLEGFYWTTANTCGEIELNLIERNCESIDSYQLAKQHDK